MDDLNQALAGRLASLRKEAGWSLDDLAARSGISRTTLSRFERMESSPTAEQLGQLCSVYACTMSAFFAQAEQSQARLLRAKEQMIWQDPGSGFLRRQVSPPAQGFHAEVLEGRLPGGAVIAYETPPVATLEQHLWMLAGTLQLDVGTQRYTLRNGDSLRFRVEASTRFEAMGKQEARYVLVIC